VNDDEDDSERTRARRSSGARHPVSDPVSFFRGERQIDGWALNVSGGGLRAIVDEVVSVDERFEVRIGDAEARPARIVWVREERGGAILGVAFTDTDEGGAPPDDPAPSPGD